MTERSIFHRGQADWCCWAILKIKTFGLPPGLWQPPIKLAVFYLMGDDWQIEGSGKLAPHSSTEHGLHGPVDRVISRLDCQVQRLIVWNSPSSPQTVIA